MKCGNCGKNLDLHENIDDKNLKYKNGDISICLYCGEINQFKNGKLELIDIRKLPLDIKNEISRIEDARKKVMIIN